MQKFTLHKGLVAPMDRENVDTDAIIPKQFLKSIKKTGFGPNLFDEWRYLDKGEPGIPESQRKPNPDFVLNQPRYQGASILLARKNFGCGSSREHAPIAILGAGIPVVVAKSFARIFYRNGFNMGLVLLEVGDDIAKLKDGDQLEVDTGKGEIKNLTTGETVVCAKVPAFMQELLDAGGLVPYVKKRLAAKQ